MDGKEVLRCDLLYYVMLYAEVLCVLRVRLVSQSRNEAPGEMRREG